MSAVKVGLSCGTWEHHAAAAFLSGDWTICASGRYCSYNNGGGRRQLVQSKNAYAFIGRNVDINVTCLREQDRNEASYFFNL